MEAQSFMQRALGADWDKLPEGLKAHYRQDAAGNNIAEGHLSIDYPAFMQWPLNGLRLLGALVNRKGDKLPTRVERRMKNGRQYWHRSIRFATGKQIHFKSQFVYNEANNTFIEYTNAFLGLKTKAYVKNAQLHYESCGYVLKLGAVQLPIPEWLALGHASIVETAGDGRCFTMDFRLQHPLFGQLFSYAGTFETW